jgi:hypothetical protein
MTDVETDTNPRIDNPESDVDDETTKIKAKTNDSSVDPSTSETKLSTSTILIYKHLVPHQW